MQYQSEKYSDLKGLINPLDIIFFKGGDLISKTICIFENMKFKNGDFSHVGIVVTRELFPFLEQLEPDRLYVFESTMSMKLGGLTDGVPNVITKKGKFGVQIRDLEQVVNSYISSDTTRVAWGKLFYNPFLRNYYEDESSFIERKRKVLESMKFIYTKYGDKIYELNPCVLFATVCMGPRILRNTIDKVEVGGHTILHTMGLVKQKGKQEIIQHFLFCSELAGLILVTLSVIDKDIDPQDLTPVDFLGFNKIPKIVLDPINILKDH